MTTVIYNRQTVTTIVVIDEIRDLPEQTGLPTLGRDLEVVSLELEIALEQLSQSINLTKSAYRVQMDAADDCTSVSLHCKSSFSQVRKRAPTRL